MNVLIGVYFNSPHGGLHDNVISSVKAVFEDGGSVTVLCKPGAFAEILKGLGCSVLETNYSILSFGLVIDLLEQINRLKPFDVIHTHPFQSRELLLYFSRRTNIPLLLTLHGQYDDELETYWDELELILTVSEGIKDFVVSRVKDITREKLYVLCNAVSDTYNFSNVEYSSLRKETDFKVVSLVTRFDADKQFILDVALEAIKWSATSPQKIFWQFIGDGDLLSSFKEKVDNLIDKNNFVFKGWLSDSDLAEKYRNSDIVIGPGRCAIDALACGVPVIAIGSKGYIGLINEISWFNGVYSNFGGVGSRFKSYESGSISKDLNKCLTISGYSNYLRELGPRLTKTFFNAENINAQLINFYNLSALKVLGTQKRPGENTELWHPKHGLIGLNVKIISSFELSVEIEHTRADKYSFAWYEYVNEDIARTHNYSSCSSRVFSFTKAGCYSIRCFLKDEQGSKVSFIVAKIEKKEFEEKIEFQTCVENGVVKFCPSFEQNESVLKSLDFSNGATSNINSSSINGLDFTI